MIKYYCDRCNGEIDPDEEDSYRTYDTRICSIDTVDRVTLCKNCYPSFETLIKETVFKHMDEYFGR